MAWPGLAWPRRTADKTAAGRRSIFRALGGWKLELARCDWPMYGASVESLSTAHIALYEIPRGYLTSAPPGALTLVLPTPRAQCRLSQPQTSVAAKASAPPSPTSPKPQPVGQGDN